MDCVQDATFKGGPGRLGLLSDGGDLGWQQGYVYHIEWSALCQAVLIALVSGAG